MLLKKEKPDIIHLNSSKMGFVGAIAGRIAGIKKIIFTAHGWAFNEDRRRWQKFIFWAIQAKTVFFCHQTIAVSEITKKQLKPKWLQNKIIVIHNGIRQETFLNKEEAKEIIKEEVKDLKWIGTISELHKNKGLEYIIKGFAKLEKKYTEDYALIIIGEGGERKRLENIINELNLQNKIYLVGKINQAGLLLKAFDIFTLTSITEALPYSILEAGLANIPIIASNVGGIPEIIENGVNGLLIPPRQIEAITEKITELIENPEKTNILASNLNNKVKTDFSIEHMIKKTIDIYSK